MIYLLVLSRDSLGSDVPPTVITLSPIPRRGLPAKQIPHELAAIRGTAAAPGRFPPHRSKQGTEMAQTVEDFIRDRLYQPGVRRILGNPGDGIDGLFGMATPRKAA